MRISYVAFVGIGFIGWSPAIGQGICDAAKIAALRTHYQMEEGTSVSDILMTRECSRFDRGSSLELTFPSEIGNIGLGGSSKSTAEACASSDSAYFETGQRHILYSFLPAEAYKALVGCFGNQLTLTAKENQKEIIVRATYLDLSGGDPVAPTVEWKWDDEVVECFPPDKPQKVVPGGTELRCKRLPNATSVSATITADTSKGDETIMLAGKYKAAFDYSVVIDESKTFAYCTRGPGGRQVGEVIGCAYGSCKEESRETLRAYCKATHGYGLIVSPGQVELEIESWTVQQVGCSPCNAKLRTYHYQCFWNGEEIGDRWTANERTPGVTRPIQIGRCITDNFAKRPKVGRADDHVGLQLQAPWPTED